MLSTASRSVRSSIPFVLAAWLCVGAAAICRGQAPNASGGAEVQLDRERFRLDWIEDRKDLVGTADVDAYYGILKHARKVDAAELRAAAREFLEQRWKQSPYADAPLQEFPLFYDMIQNPQAWRGKPVTLAGHIQLHHVRHNGIEHGVDPVHEAYLYTEDSQRHPATIVFTENPDRIPAGEETISGIQVTGYFLKLYPYASRDGKGRYSPLILAHEMRWTPPQPVRMSRSTQIAVAIGVGVLVLVAIAAVRMLRASDRRAREREAQLLGRDQPPDFSAIDR